MLELVDVHKSYHDGESELEVLRGVELRLAAGESVALRGESGSGKSTLLQIAAGLESPDRGSVCIDGHDLSGLAEPELAMLRREGLGFVFQQFNLIPGLSGRENLLFQRRLNRMPDGDSWIDELIVTLELEPLLPRPVEVLSGGQQQRIAIGRALAHRPRLVFADEPTGNLHDTLSHQVVRLLVRLVQEAGSGLLLVTHSAKLATFADRRLRLRRGRLVDDIFAPEDSDAEKAGDSDQGQAGA
ncbi:MAG: ABC transporter ATP-binding protein [Xanthomonadales bacterium]|nr:ABC transporter ATP-binding protein [Xanthomonadales bacterium]